MRKVLLRGPDKDVDGGGGDDVQANPFGSAKPVDAAAKLKELDERDAKRKVGLHDISSVTDITAS